ncbi:hypothetical protein ANO14919_069860 [Xylariales sp. No.14919]|nr:hypothetical protein ANO14919_069860 [Xylariales sp. No.14919]
MDSDSRNDPSIRLNADRAQSSTTTPTSTPTPAKPSSLQPSPRQPSPHQPATSRLTATGTPLGSNTPPSLGATAAEKVGQDSKSYHYLQPRPPNGVFGENRQTLGIPVDLPPLDPHFRAAAANNDMIRAFVIARDKICRGEH